MEQEDDKEDQSVAIPARSPRLCAMATSTLLRLVEAGGAELTANLSDLLPLEVAGRIGSQTREVRTRGDGACALHAAFATLGCSDSLQLEDPRRYLRSILGYTLEVIRSRMRPFQHHLLQGVMTSLWENVLLFGAEREAARNEEALPLSH